MTKISFFEDFLEILGVLEIFKDFLRDENLLNFKIFAIFTYFFQIFQIFKRDIKDFFCDFF